MKQQNGMITGTKGVQYGLQLSAGAPSIKRTGPAKVAPVRPANIFGVDSDDEETVGSQLARQADKKRAAVKVQQQYEEALTQDASVFDYDGVYDSLQQARVQPRQQEKVERQSRYIAQLKDQAEQRKREADVSYERRLLKDRQTEDHQFEGKEKFVTGAYRKKLEEDKKWMEAEKIREAEESQQDVRKVGHMGNFYSNLLSKNVAFGNKILAVPAASKQESAPDGETGGSSSSGKPLTGQPTLPAAQEQGAKAGAGTAGPGTSAPAMDKYDTLRQEAERAMRRQEHHKQQSTGLPADADADAASPPSPAQSSEAPKDHHGLASHADREDAGTCQPSGTAKQEAEQESKEAPTEGEMEAARAAAATAKAAAAAAAANAGKRRTDEAGVQSAKERYLARKAQKTG